MTRTFSLFAGIGLLLTGACQPAADPGDFALAGPVLSSTESSKEFGDYVVHFNAQTTDRLSAELATEHDILRSTRRGILTVSVLKNEEGTMGVPVQADVQASAVNLTGQLKTLNIREIREEDTIYYIADTDITDSETLVFSVNATPDNGTEALSFRFMRQFFVD